MSNTINQTARYPIARQLRHLCAGFDISVPQVLTRAGLPPDVFEDERRGVTAEQFYAVLEAAFAVADRPNMSVDLGVKLARGPFVPAAFAFSCSPVVEEGTRRLGIFKPLVAPIKLECAPVDAGFQVSFSPIPADIHLPNSFAEFELVYFVELCRTLTGSPIVPLDVELPSAGSDAIVTYFGTTPRVGPNTRLILAPEDARRPLLTADDALWQMFEPTLRREIAARTTPSSTQDRVRSTLTTLLPAGYASVDAVAEHLGQSKRSLQRALAAEGQSFQTVLNTTRRELAEHYLAEGDLKMDEISYLLAYRDPNSFFRAFHQWTGQTPAAARKA